MYLTSSATPVSSTMPQPAAPRGDPLKRVIGFSRAAMPDHPWTDKVQVLRDDRRLELQVNPVGVAGR
jgi:hypothetical protein